MQEALPLCAFSIVPEPKQVSLQLEVAVLLGDCSHSAPQFAHFLGLLLPQVAQFLAAPSPQQVDLQFQRIHLLQQLRLPLLLGCQDAFQGLFSVTALPVGESGEAGDFSLEGSHFLLPGELRVGFLQAVDVFVELPALLAKYLVFLFYILQLLPQLLVLPPQPGVVSLQLRLPVLPNRHLQSFQVVLALRLRPARQLPLQFLHLPCLRLDFPLENAASLLEDLSQGPLLAAPPLELSQRQFVSRLSLVVVGLPSETASRMVAGDGSGAALASGVFSVQQAGTSVGGLAALNEELGELGTRGTVFTVAFARGVRLAGEALGKRGTVGGTVVEQAAPRGDRTHQRQLFQRTNSPNHNSRNPLLAVPTKPTPQSPPPPPSALCRPPHPLPTTAPPLLSFLQCLPVFNPLQLHSLLPSSGVWVCAGVFVGVQPGWSGVEYQLTKMALTTLQNCQRIIIMMEWLTLFSVGLFLTIRIIKKKIDLPPPPNESESDSAGVQYQEENSVQQFEKAAVAATVLQETDTCTERFMKKVCEYNVLFSPLLISLPLNLVVGRSMAFCIAMYCMGLVLCLVFNLFKVHRACIEHKVSRLFLESLWAVFAILLLVNIFTTPSSTMPYLLTA